MPRTRVSARSRSRAIGAAGVLGAVVTATLLAGGTAYAHVTVDPAEAEKGGYAALTFRVPNESEHAGTVRLSVELPAETPISSVRTQPKPGWSAKVHTEKLDEPVDVGGIDVEEAVTRVTWTAADGTAIGPDEFEEFRISAGPLPSTVENLELPATQTYDDGEVVRWNQPMGEDGTEPERPAPVLSLQQASESGHGHGAGADTTGGGEAAGTDGGTDAGADDSANAGSSTEAVDGTARTLGGVGTAVGVAGLLVGVGAIVSSRRSARAATETLTKE